MSTTPNPTSPVAVSPAELAAMRDALRQLGARTRRPVRCPYVRNLRKAVFTKHTAKPDAMLLALAVDAIQRRAPQEDVEAPALAYLAIVRARFAAEAARLTFAELHDEEEAAQGQCERAESALAHEWTPANVRRYLGARVAHRIAAERMEAYVRARAVREGVAA